MMRAILAPAIAIAIAAVDDGIASYGKGDCATEFQPLGAAAKPGEYAARYGNRACVFRSLLDSADELSWTAGTAGAGHSVRRSWSFPDRGREHLCSFVQSPFGVIQGAGATS